MRARADHPANVSVTLSALRPNLYDMAVFLLVVAAFAGVAYGARAVNQPLSSLDAAPIQLDPGHLPNYALLTTLRMFAAIACSLVFTFATGWAAAKSRKAEMVIVPALDILQSVPILGFLTFTVMFFMGAFPGSRRRGAAAVFAIFTSQAWNMAFSFYQSLKTLPPDLDEAARHFRLSPWQRFWRLEAPYATPGLVWNAMMSMSGGWFFVVASESISIGATKIALPGVGSYLAAAIDQKNLGAVGWAVATMALVILAYDQLLFRPVVAWADKFRVEQVASRARPQSWVYDLLRRTRLLRRLGALGFGLHRRDFARSAGWRRSSRRASPTTERAARAGDLLWTAAVAAAALWAAWLIARYLAQGLAPGDVAEAFKAGFATLLRVVALIAAASVIWVPIGVWIGLRPALAERLQPLAQFLAAFPANVLFPIFVVAIARGDLDPNVWLSPLMVLGTQWYILFNVIAGASVFPGDLLEAASMSRVRGRLWWRSVMLPGVFPYYVTGALTASGGCWNASIVAEVASWGDTRLEAYGLGAYIANATEAGNYHKVVLGVAVMSVFVLAFNRLVWRRMYRYAERRLRL
ncbi:MAG: ABC transporter permease subunit [Rhodoblastus sp.]|nr:MAG: ABC transporter permease subunit [Rhodoblastus sp.]